MASLEIERTSEGPIPVFAFRGDLDHCTIEHAEKYLESVDFTGINSAVFDFSGLDYANSACARVIMPLLTRFRSEGGDLKFCGAHGRVLDVVLLLGLDSFIDFSHKTPEEAMNSFARSNPAEWMSVVREIYIGPAKGDKFHLGSCRYASRIAETERVVFDTRQAALDAGRRPCRNCKP